MPSQLWQRLRAARKYADLRQQDVATACGVGRTAVTLWESADENARTRPDLNLMPVLAKLYKLPVEWLMNDGANVDDVWKIGALHKTSPTLPIANVANAVMDPSRVKESFMRATEFEIMQINPNLIEGFANNLGTGVARVKADFAYGDVVAQFAVAGPGGVDMGMLGQLLLLERAAGRELRKFAILWCREDGGFALGEVAVAQLQSAFGVRLITVKSPAEGAQFLASVIR